MTIKVLVGYNWAKFNLFAHNRSHRGNALLDGNARAI